MTHGKNASKKGGQKIMANERNKPTGADMDARVKEAIEQNKIKQESWNSVKNTGSFREKVEASDTKYLSKKEQRKLKKEQKKAGLKSTPNKIESEITSKLSEVTLDSFAKSDSYASMVESSKSGERSVN